MVVEWWRGQVSLHPVHKCTVHGTPWEGLVRILEESLGHRYGGMGEHGRPLPPPGRGRCHGHLPRSGAGVEEKILCAGV